MRKKEMEMEIKRLKEELFKAKTQLNLYLYELALTNIEKCGKDRKTGSGVVLSLKDLSGKDIVEPICIDDGLSKESIEALKKDIERTVKKSFGFNFFMKRTQGGAEKC